MASKFIGDHSGDGSQLTNVTAVGTSTTGSYTTHTTAHGSIQLGPMNGSWTHIYTTANTNFYFNKDLYVLGHKVWHANNDGSGSGMDADLLDGVQASSFLRSDTWADQQGGVNITKNIGTSMSWTNGSSQLSLENTDAGWVGINFHRAGYTSNNIYHNGSNFTMDSSVSVSGNITASGDVTAYSDRRFKHDIETISGALDTVSKMRGTSYIHNNKDSIGVIAQEVEEVVPELVHTDEDGMKSVAYGNMAALFIESIKELKDIVAKQQAEIEELRNGK